MIKKINVLGMELDNYTVREAILQVDTYMNSSMLNIIETVSMQRILYAADNPMVYGFLNKVDLAIIEDAAILQETGNYSAQLVREIRTHDFLQEILKRIVRSQKKVFLIAMTQKEIAEFTADLRERAPSIIVEKSYAIEECTGDMDAVVNEINAATPDVVLSAMTTPYEEEFLLSRKEKICGSVWFGMGECCFKKGGIHLSKWIQKQIQRMHLHIRMLKYNKEERE